VLGLLVFVAMLTWWMRRKQRHVATRKRSTVKNRDIEMTSKDLDRAEDERRRDEEEGEGLMDGPPTYQVAAQQK
jgi:hypothetical protein